MSVRVYKSKAPYTPSVWVEECIQTFCHDLYTAVAATAAHVFCFNAPHCSTGCRRDGVISGSACVWFHPKQFTVLKPFRMTMAWVVVAPAASLHATSTAPPPPRAPLPASKSFLPQLERLSQPLANLFCRQPLTSLLVLWAFPLLPTLNWLLPAANLLLKGKLLEEKRHLIWMHIFSLHMNWHLNSNCFDGVSVFTRIFKEYFLVLVATIKYIASYHL
jgi:hypothetical protein